MKLKKLITEFIKDNNAQSEGNTLYMLLVVAIVAIILIAVVKPMFNKSVKTSSEKAKLPSESTSQAGNNSSSN